MGLNNENAVYSPIVVDIETCGLLNAGDYLEPPQPDRRLTDKTKIAEDIRQKTVEQLAMCSLDWNVGRIAAIGWWENDESGVSAHACPGEDDEKLWLSNFWALVRSRHSTIVGFNIRAFDLRFMIRRSQLLGVNYIDVDISKYAKRGSVDLYLDLTFGDGFHDKGAMRRSLKAFCKRFGIPVTDDIKGEDIPKLVEAGEWDKVLSHVRSDVEMTVALARKLGVIQPAMETVL